MTVHAAKVKAQELPGCQGFCYAGEDLNGLADVFFKSKWDNNPSDANWTSYRLESSRPVSGQRVEVQRLSVGFGGHGWRFHDRRALEISGSNPLIFDKGSTSKVKAAI